MAAPLQHDDCTMAVEAQRRERQIKRAHTMQHKHNTHTPTNNSQGSSKHKEQSTLQLTAAPHLPHAAGMARGSARGRGRPWPPRCPAGGGRVCGVGQRPEAPASLARFLPSIICLKRLATSHAGVATAAAGACGCFKKFAGVQKYFV